MGNSPDSGNYYPRGMSAFLVAVKERDRRCGTLRAVQQELEKISEAIVHFNWVRPAWNPDQDPCPRFTRGLGKVWRASGRLGRLLTMRLRISNGRSRSTRSWVTFRILAVISNGEGNAMPLLAE